MRQLITVISMVLVLWAGLSGCGVKAPPIAPESDPETPELKLDCSPYDEECDVTDPNYKPQGVPAR